MAIRWASDRIGDQGVIALVTNGSWIDGNVDSGVRACLAEEFSSIYVLNLRGNARTSGKLRREEGDNVFGQGSRAPVAITILVRNPDAAHDGCRILYRDIGDYLKREEKLAILRKAGSIAGIEDWRTIEPDRHHDWIGQRSDVFQQLYPMGSKDAKAGKVDDAIFKLFSNGYKTGRDAYVYNFSLDVCAENGKRMTDEYMSARDWLNDYPYKNVTEATKRHSESVIWDAKLQASLKAGRIPNSHFSPPRKVAYRPFVNQHLYADEFFAQRPAQTRDIFPDASSENRAICVPGIGSTKPFSALVVDTMPDLELISKGQCFPRYRYRQPADAQGTLPGVGRELERIDNITDTAVRAFRVRYNDNTITKDGIFDYVYGVLHAPAYRERFANDLTKELPRLPLAHDFHAFARAGRELAELHLGYETCQEYPLDVTFTQLGEPRPEQFRVGERAMRYSDNDRTILIVNDHLRLGGIPPGAHQYQVNGRTPLEWFIDRYRITRNKESGIVNDPNAWFDDPRELIAMIFDYYTKLDFYPAHKIHKIHALRMVSASSALSSFFCYRGLAVPGPPARRPRRGCRSSREARADRSTGCCAGSGRGCDRLGWPRNPPACRWSRLSVP